MELLLDQQNDYVWENIKMVKNEANLLTLIPKEVIEVIENFNARDYAACLKELRPLAEQGYPSAQYMLGCMYDDGLGVTQDDKETVKWFQLAAEQGYARARYNLGLMYYSTICDQVEQDYEEAVKWLRLAAEQGYASAQYMLFTMYHSGEGVTQDDKEAAKWFRLSDEQDDADAHAQFNLSLCYRDGLGVEKDLEKAFCWYEKATEQDNATTSNIVKYFEDQKNVLNFEYWKKKSRKNR